MRWAEAKPYSRRRPPEALKALPRVGRSDRRQLNGITRLDHGVNKDAFLSCRFVAENATTDPLNSTPMRGGGPLIRVPDGGGCGDLQKRHNHAQLCPENP